MAWIVSQPVSTSAWPAVRTRSRKGLFGLGSMAKQPTSLIEVLLIRPECVCISLRQDQLAEEGVAGDLDFDREARP